MARDTAHLKTFDLKEKKLQLITVVLLIVLLPLLLYLLQQALQIGIRGEMTSELSIVPSGISPDASGRWVLPKGQEVPIDIVLNSGTNQIEAIEVTVNYDPTVLSLIGPTGYDNNKVSCNQVSPLNVEWIEQIGGLSADAQGNIIGTESGTVTVVCSAVPKPPWDLGVAIYTPTTAGYNQPVATLRFATLKDAINSALSIEFTPTTPENDSSVLVYEGGCCSTTETLSTVNNLTFDVGAGSTTPTATPTLPPAGSRQIRIKTSMQGREWIGAPMTRDVTVLVLGPNANFGPFQAVVDTNSEVLVNLPSNYGDGFYTVNIKPLGFLQRQASGNVVNGQNFFDISSTPFLGGDLDGSGTVNSGDYNIMLQQFKSTNPLADLDGSGQINGFDYSYMLSNWNKTGDGE